jgi:hypothetical protein
MANVTRDTLFKVQQEGKSELKIKEFKKAQMRWQINFFVDV